MIKIEYNIEDDGWALAKISNGKEQSKFSVSYLNDSLLELAESAIEIGDKHNKSIVFMEEPGEHVLILNCDDGEFIDYELRWYKEWWSWGMEDENNYKVVLNGQTRVVKYVNQVKNLMEKIITEIGIEKYKQKWVKHDFPFAEYEKLK